MHPTCITLRCSHHFSDLPAIEPPANDPCSPSGSLDVLEPLKLHPGHPPSEVRLDHHNRRSQPLEPHTILCVCVGGGRGLAVYWSRIPYFFASYSFI